MILDKNDPTYGTPETRHQDLLRMRDKIDSGSVTRRARQARIDKMRPKRAEPTGSINPAFRAPSAC